MERNRRRRTERQGKVSKGQKYSEKETGMKTTTEKQTERHIEKENDSEREGVSDKQNKELMKSRLGTPCILFHL